MWIKTSIWTAVKGSQVVNWLILINWYCQCIFLNPFGHRAWVQATVCFRLERWPVHLELTAPGMETQPYHLPWTDPDCSRMGEALDHLQYINNIIVWGSRTEVFEKGKKIIQILLKACFAINQSEVKGPVQEIQFYLFQFSSPPGGGESERALHGP